ncbi:small ubiquitin-related modifier 2, partial [Clarias magur]
MADEKPKEGVKTENNEHINLKVAGQDGSVVQFKIKRHTPLSKLMKAYCERQGLTMRQIRFRFDGQPINETDTPAQGMDPEAKSSSRVLRPPGGGSNISFGNEEEKPAARKNKMASSIFAEPEDPHAHRRNNPPGESSRTRNGDDGKNSDVGSWSFRWRSTSDPGPEVLLLLCLYICSDVPVVLCQRKQVLSRVNTLEETKAGASNDTEQHNRMEATLSTLLYTTESLTWRK